MYVKAIQSTKGSIFPIIGRISKNSKYEGRFVAGTGFFIDNKGHFVTANHVVSGNSNEVVYESLGNIPHSRFSQITPELIQPIGRLPDLDLFVGKLDQMILPPLELKESNSPEGTSIVVGGYPFPNIKKSEKGDLNFFTVRQYWQSTMIMDYFNMSHLNPNLRYDGFIVDHRTIPGMSGGPAIDLLGNVVGMCTAQITRKAKDNIPHINGVFLDVQSLNKGISTILSSHYNAGT